MSSKKLQVGNDIFDYPVTGSSNYGEEATGWADAITEAVKEIKGPGDISTTETILSGTDNLDGTSTGFVSGLQFDTSFVQRISVTGIITREYTVASGKSREVESFVIEGAYNGVEFNITEEMAGDDTEVTLFTVGGQFKFTSVNVADTQELKIKFQGKALIDEDAL
jgi:hypothetical protein